MGAGVLALEFSLARKVGLDAVAYERVNSAAGRAGGSV